MKITVNINEQKIAFFIELLRNLDFVTIESAQEIDGTELSKEHKLILDQRLASYKSDPNGLFDWEDFKDDMNQKMK